MTGAVFSSGGRPPGPPALPAVAGRSGGRPPGPPALPAVAEAAGVGYSCGPVDQIPYGEGRAFAAGDHQVAVFRKRDGSFRALSAVCPHKGGPIADGQIDNRVVLCPLHLNAFQLDTGCSTTGAAPLRVYPVYVEDGEIVVLVS